MIEQCRFGGRRRWRASRRPAQKCANFTQGALWAVRVLLLLFTPRPEAVVFVKTWWFLATLLLFPQKETQIVFPQQADDWPTQLREEWELCARTGPPPRWWKGQWPYKGEATLPAPPPPAARPQFSPVPPPLLPEDEGFDSSPSFDPDLARAVELSKEEWTAGLAALEAKPFPQTSACLPQGPRPLPLPPCQRRVRGVFVEVPQSLANKF